MKRAICKQAQECCQQGEDTSQALVCGRCAAKERVSFGTQDTETGTRWCTPSQNFSVPYICSTRAFGSPFLRSFGGRYINSGRGCTTELLSLQEHGDCHSLFSSLTCFERRALKEIRQIGQSLSIHASAESSGTRAIPIRQSHTRASTRARAYGHT
jgi:hypothetical protein